MKNDEVIDSTGDLKEKDDVPKSGSKMIRQTYNKISNEIRQKIIHSIEHGEGTRKSIALTYGIPYATVISIHRRHSLTGNSVKKKKTFFQDILFNEEQAKYIIDLLAEDCTRTIKDLRKLLEDKYEVHLSSETIKKFMSTFNYTLKRTSKIIMPIVNNKIISKRKKYCDFYMELIICGRVLIYFDETSFKVSVEHFLKNKLINTCLKKKTKTIMASMTNGDFLYYKAFNGSGNQKFLLEYLYDLFSLLQKKSITEAVIIMNKTVSCHNDDEVREIIRDAGHDVLFITPHTPSFNPVDIMFSQWDSLIRSKCPRNVLELFDLVDSFRGVMRPELCSQYCKDVLDNIRLCLTETVT